jgi:hypothetical protein
MITIRINDQATPFFNRAIAQVKRPRVLLEAASKEVVQTLKAHFKSKQLQGNKRGWRERYFWYGVRNSVAQSTGVSSITDTKAVVTVASPAFAHKVTGGPIVPKLRKWLTIPLTEQAYLLGGKGTVRESQPDLFPITTKRGSYLVRNIVESRGRGKLRNNRLEFWFRLVKRVDQDADPTALPPEADLAAAVERSARIVLPRLLKNA